MKLTFLNAHVPLTKSYTKLPDGTIEKSSYPNVWEVTSHIEDCPNLAVFEHLIIKHAALGNCLLKGMVTKPLISESRKDSTDRNAPTEFLCLDIDGISPTFTTTSKQFDPITQQETDVQTTTNVTVDMLMEHMGLKDVSYILQWSGSMNITGTGLRCHVFIMLTKPVSAPLIKQWLIQKNHELVILREHQALTKTGNALTWGLDVTACQSDKLIYIADPVLKGIKNPLGRMKRVSTVTKANATFDLAGRINSTEQNRLLTDARVIELRELAGLPKRKLNYKTVGPHQVLVKPDECIATEMKVDRGFVYFNLNGGDSWAYYHPENNPDYIFNFKGEPTYLTKELLPSYWESLKTQAYRVSSTGLTYLAFLERETSTYYRGTYDSALDCLDIYAAKNENMVRQFADANGLRLGDNIPEWDMSFNPHDNVRVDFDNRTVNTFQLTDYMRAPVRKVNKCPPTIFKIIEHVLAKDVEAIEYFMNWLAFIAQERDRSMTAWIFQGTQGCLAGDTTLQFKRGKRNSGREVTVKQAYEFWTGANKGRNGKGWDMSKPTFTKSVKDNMTIGYHEIYKIVESGVKQLYTLTTVKGRRIRVTELHPFMRTDGSFTPLNELTSGDDVIVEGVPLEHVDMPQGRKARHTTYSIPHHLYAWKHMINGKNYQRSHTARLVVEADMNGLSLKEFVHVLRTDSIKSACFKYLGFDRIVHHIDEDPSNDALSNLAVVSKENHDEHHAKEVGLGTISTHIDRVKSITKDKEEMTYDLIMKAPYHNYIANGFAVHNTGKGLLMNKILKPLFGDSQTVIKRAGELSEKWTDFVTGKLMVFIDEVQTSAFKDEAGVIANLKNFITEPTVTIRMMNKNAYSMRNFTNWLFASNKPDPVSVDKEDRRFNVGPYQGLKIQITDQEIAQIEKELQDFHHYLMSYAMDKTQANNIMESAARKTLIELSQTTAETTASSLQEGNAQFFLDQLPTDESYKLNPLTLNKVEDYRKTLFNVLARTKPDGKCSVHRDELFVIFNYTVGGMNPSPTTFTRFLGHRQIEIRPVTIDGKTVRGITTTWTDVADFPKHLKTYFSDMKQRA